MYQSAVRPINTALKKAKIDASLNIKTTCIYACIKSLRERTACCCYLSYTTLSLCVCVYTHGMYILLHMHFFRGSNTFDRRAATSFASCKNGRYLRQRTNAKSRVRQKRGKFRAQENPEYSDRTGRARRTIKTLSVYVDDVTSVYRPRRVASRHAAYPNYSIYDAFSVHRVSKDFFSSHFNHPSQLAKGENERVRRSKSFRGSTSQLESTKGTKVGLGDRPNFFTVHATTRREERTCTSESFLPRQHFFPGLPPLFSVSCN